MPKMNVAVPHKLNPDEAVRRIKNLVGDMKKQFGDRITDLKEEWSGNNGQFAFKAMGFDVSGTVRVDADEVRIEGNLPFAASMFKGRIESTIQERASQLLA